MVDRFNILILLLLIPLFSINSFAQNKVEDPGQNPFSQPDFLKYTPPVKARVEAVEIEEVMPEFKLSATFISVNGPMAIVNDNLLTIDEEIEGIRLIMVGEETAKIRYKGKIVDIKINEAKPAKIQKIRRSVVK
ncbi:MAG: hypothetical protein KAI17_16745 [Thiotrichaceae bacterium]|nr:hypothetical protein [Thiotrichaceae bacterium]